ncbi:hypothetical protein GF380_05525 [Candidatus Uhrbacteria bacterium]|nr:hypothetical protein [Candidatus Uhrbacteria bacterium]
MVEDVSTTLLRALGALQDVQPVTLRSEGPIVRGRAYLNLGEERFLDFYFNEKTGTMAFALIEKQQRIWGIDKDAIRGWHGHPLEKPDTHVELGELYHRWHRFATTDYTDLH